MKKEDWKYGYAGLVLIISLIGLFAVVLPIVGLVIIIGFGDAWGGFFFAPLAIGIIFMDSSTAENNEWNSYW